MYYSYFVYFLLHICILHMPNGYRRLGYISIDDSHSTFLGLSFSRRFSLRAHWRLAHLCTYILQPVWHSSPNTRGARNTRGASVWRTSRRYYHTYLPSSGVLFLTLSFVFLPTDVSRFLDSSLSGGSGGSCGTGSWEARYRWQLEQLRQQLHVLLLRYPSLRPSADETDDVTYDDTAEADPAYDDTGKADPEYDDAAGAGETAQEAFYDDAGGDVIAEDTYEEPAQCGVESAEPQEEYDELGPAPTGQQPGAVTEQPNYDDTAPLVGTEPYLAMGGKAARTLGIAVQLPPRGKSFISYRQRHHYMASPELVKYGADLGDDYITKMRAKSAVPGMRSTIRDRDTYS